MFHLGYLWCSLGVGWVMGREGVNDEEAFTFGGIETSRPIFGPSNTGV